MRLNLAQLRLMNGKARLAQSPSGPYLPIVHVLFSTIAMDKHTLSMLSVFGTPQDGFPCLGLEAARRVILKIEKKKVRGSDRCILGDESNVRACVAHPASRLELIISLNRWLC